MPKVITFATLKGGVGKTMSTFNIAGILAEEGNKVLVVDSDPQGNSTNNFGVNRTKKDMKSFKDVLEDNANIEEVIVKSPIPELKNLDIIPSSIFLSGTELRIINFAGRESILKNYFDDNKDYLSQYDYIILDTNPSMSIINQNVFFVSEHIIMVSDVDMNALDGAELFMALWEDTRNRLRKKDNVSGLLINNLDKRIKLSEDIIEYCSTHEEFKTLMFKTVIPMNVKLKEAVLDAKPINIFDKKSKGYESFKNVVEEMKNRGIL